MEEDIGTPNRTGAFCWNTLTLKTANHTYEIRPSTHNQTKIWIQTEEGEGGEFDAGLFFDLIDKFYKENF